MKGAKKAKGSATPAIDPPSGGRLAELAGPGKGARFLARFGILVAVYYLLTALPWVDRHVLYPVLELNARGVSALLNLLGHETTHQGIAIHGPRFSVAVRRGCDPLEPIMLFGAAVLAFPGAWKGKFWGLAAGSLFFCGLNLVRILTLYLAGQSQAAWFDTLHQEAWPALFILLAVLLWAAWLRWPTARKPQTHG